MNAEQAENYALAVIEGSETMSEVAFAKWVIDAIKVLEEIATYGKQDGSETDEALLARNFLEGKEDKT